MKVEEPPERLQLAVKRWQQRVEFGWEPGNDGMLVFDPDLIALAKAFLRELGLPVEPNIVKRPRKPH